jgi:hypothetical protein
MVQALSLADLVNQAEVVAVARVISQKTGYDDRGRIVTDVQMQVERAEKGDLAPGSSIVVRRLGGVVNGVGMRVEGEPSFEDGETVLLFGANPLKRAHLRPVGMGQGAMRIFEQQGERWVRSATGGISLVPKSAGDSGQAAVAVPRKLDDVLGEIRGLVGKSTSKP